MDDRRPLYDDPLLLTLIDSIGDGVIVVDENAEPVHWNAAAERLLGVAAFAARSGAWIERPGVFLADGVTPAPAAERPLARAARRGEHVDDAELVIARGGSPTVRISVTARPLRDREGNFRGAIGVFRDITAMRRLESELARRVSIFRAMLAGLPNCAVWLVDDQLRYVWADGPARALFARTSKIRDDDVSGHSVDEVAADEHARALAAAYRAALDGATQSARVVRDGRTFDGHIVPLAAVGDLKRSALAFVYDVTDIEANRQALEREHAIASTMLANIRDGVVLLDAQRSLVLANAAYAQMFGLDPGDLEGMSRDEFITKVAPMFADPETFAQRIRELSVRAVESTDEFVIERPERRVLRRRVHPVTAHDGAWHIVIWQDVTAEKTEAASRERSLMLDAITKLPNRRAGEAALADAVADARRRGSGLCVAVFDIDQFKRINDTHGHAAGDEALAAIAHALATNARASDTVARWGGDELIAILPGPLEGARAFCERARSAVAGLALASGVACTLSAGIAAVAPDDERGEDAVRRADAHLYDAKNAGRNCTRG